MKRTNLFFSFFLLALLVIFSNQAMAQSGYLEDRGSGLWEQEGFVDETGEEFDTSSGEYVGEEEIKAMERRNRQSQIPNLNLAEALEKDKEYLPDNIVYGLSTGLTIGVWFALLQGTNARENTSYIGVGIVVGTLLGMAVGTKSVFMRQPAPKLGSWMPQNQPLNRATSNKPSLALMDLSWSF